MSRVVSLCWTEDCISAGKWKIPGAFLLTSLLYELLSTQSMSILSGLYRAVSSKDAALFQNTLYKALAIVFALALLKSIANYFNNLCAIRWRMYLVEHIHSKYAQYTVQVQNGTSLDINTKDQRITQDVDRLTTKAAELIANVIVLPAVIMYYAIFLLTLFGWMAPASCFLYFLFGAIVCYLVARRVVDVVCLQEQLEGEFRQRHCQAQQHAQEVYLLRGEVEEVHHMQLAFSLLLNNSNALALRKLWVSICTHWFAYAGAIVNYVIIGVAIFYVRGDDAEGSESGEDRVALLAQGSYACMYLINALSTILNSSENASEVLGLARRVSELLERLPEEEGEGVGHSDSAANHGKQSVERNRQSSVSPTNAWSPLSIRNGRGGAYQPLSTLEDGGSVEMTEGTTQIPTAAANSVNSSIASTSIGDVSGIAVLSIKNVDVICESERRDCGVSGMGPFGDRQLPRRVLVRRLSLQVWWGMRLLVTGPSGCGKSTLLRLIAHAARTQISGAEQERVEGVNISVAPDLVVICPQTPHLFKGTLEENLLYPQQNHIDATSESSKGDRLRHVLTAVGMDAFASCLRSGEQRDWAATTSPGERQRLAVARAIVQRPPLVLLDEVSSALDELAERVLYSAIATYCPTFISLGNVPAVIFTVKGVNASINEITFTQDIALLSGNFTRTSSKFKLTADTQFQS